MHIPDGYLSPATCLAMYGAAAPFWYQASKRVKRVLSSQSAPLLAVFAAFSFTVQMFNIPVPPGTSAHAVGGTLVAIVLGPWAAIVALSVALIVQALFFGDGGITTIGANAFNLAISLPLTGYAVYALLSRGAALASRRRFIAAAVGAYAGLNVAGLFTGLELGLQPILWSEGGRALYSPYGLEATLPAMAITHLTVAGFAEAALTALGLAYLIRVHPALFVSAPAPTGIAPRPRRGIWVLVATVGAMVLLVPLGLLAPSAASFEWGAQEIGALVGYVPAGMEALSETWLLAPFSRYQWPGFASGGLGRATGYVLSAAVGVGLIFVLTLLARMALAKRGQDGG